MLRRLVSEFLAFDTIERQSIGSLEVELGSKGLPDQGRAMNILVGDPRLHLGQVPIEEVIEERLSLRLVLPENLVAGDSSNRRRKIQLLKFSDALLHVRYSLA